MLLRFQTETGLYQESAEKPFVLSSSTEPGRFCLCPENLIKYEFKGNLLGGGNLKTGKHLAVVRLLVDVFRQIHNENSKQNVE